MSIPQRSVFSGYPGDISANPLHIELKKSPLEAGFFAV
jgi:hypothetical protein